ncbi:MAG: hypothetical protein Kow0031_08130 [Anaerolineae bacterium]
MPNSICFVTPQIFPGTAGGIGRLIQANALALANAGWQVILLLDVPDEALARFRRYQAREMPTATVTTPSELLANLPPENLPPPAAFAAEAHWRAYRLALALNQLLKIAPIDGVELVDYQGGGCTIARWRRLIDGPLRHSRLWVRLHGSSELWHQFDQPVDYSSASLIQYRMERYTLAHVDGWLAPSPALARQYQQYYRLEPPVVAHAPAFERLGPGNTHPRQINRQKLRLLFYGKLQHLKGADLFVQAAVRLCRRFETRLDFDLVGGEDPGLADRFGSYTDQLRALIPPRFQDRFHFHGQIEPAQLPALASSATLAVFPSRIETFCLAAHELNWLGVPLVLNDIPAFADYFTHGRNCLKFNGTAENLADVLHAVLTAEAPFAGWDDPTPPPAADPVDVYRTVLQQFSPPSPAMASPQPVAAVVWRAGPVLNLHRALANLTAAVPRLAQILVVAAPAGEVAGINPKAVFPAISQAVAHTQAPYVLLLHSGDALLPEFGARLRQALAGAPQAGGVGCYARQADDGAGFAPIPPPPDPRLLFFENRLHWSGTVFKRDVLLRHWQDAAVTPAGNWDFWLRLVAAGVDIELIPLPLCRVAPPAALPPLAAAATVSELVARHPALVEQFGAEVIKLYAFNYRQQQSGAAFARKTWLAERRELEGRFNSRHIIARQFVQLTRTTILKASRNPRQAWRKFRNWLEVQEEQSL